ncbi:MAG: KpsF/GutQ family sugar-phosphate isomerase [Saprospiraceae bacterium]|nr:KpsF/GutQ family sugar-phosphate isomerase [Saprospiraceae bacterium]
MSFNCLLLSFIFSTFFQTDAKNTKLQLKNHIIIKEKIQQTLAIEGNTLIGLSKHVPEETIKAVEHIFYSRGRLIITGIGKSAIIAQKIVATLNSTGTASFFMHAADAIHGDLGMIREDDVVMCISKSGDTAEIKVLVPLIKSFGNTLIGMVCNESSFLGKSSDFRIVIPVDQEADPNNLAPTTSTTAQLAMGDAISMSLLTLRGFSPDHFAKYHPGGSLGKQLYMRVDDIYRQNEKPKVYLTDKLKTVIMEITSKRLGMTAVLDDNENLQGIITDGDLRRMLEIQTDISGIHASDIMNVKPKTISGDTLAIEALNIMRSHSITQLIVLDDRRYAGVLHLHDLLREGIV